MPRLNFYIILFALLVYPLTSGVTLRDRLLIATLHRIERNAQAEPSAKELFEGAMTGMIDILSEEHGDWYSMYIPPSEEEGYQDELHNRYEGIGIATRTREEGAEKQLLVDYPLYNSPAYRAGLRAGDKILEIDGVTIADKTGLEIFELLYQPSAQETRLTVLPFGKTEPQEISVRREKINRDSVHGDYYDSGSRVFHLEAHPKIGYIRITTFSESTAEEFGDALERMMTSGVTSFILDLRDNVGGDMRNCIEVTQMLLSPHSENNVIVTVQPRNGRVRNRILNEGSQRCSLPMVVLIDGDSASASEILAAALQDHHRATIVGTRSFGKGVIQGIISLPFQSGMLQLTDAEYRRPSGGIIHRKKNAPDTDEWGIIPDIIVELSEEERPAVMQYRLWRSNVIATDRAAVLEQFRQHVVETQDKKENELEQNPFVFSGAAPYYDLQMDEAIKVLLR